MTQTARLPLPGCEQYMSFELAGELMAEGRSNHGIGERLVITERAVQKHASSIFRKLWLAESSDDHRRVLAVLTFLNA
jgi:DNA-binding NarL/FixJ family response regulator